jgi:hypothetical protein
VDLVILQPLEVARDKVLGDSAQPLTHAVRLVFWGRVTARGEIESRLDGTEHCRRRFHTGLEQRVAPAREFGLGQQTRGLAVEHRCDVGADAPGILIDLLRALRSAS